MAQASNQLSEVPSRRRQTDLTLTMEGSGAQMARERQVAMRTKGRPNGPVTRVLSPSDIGELIKPFVFLDYFDFTPTGGAMFPMHPHSGIATLTLLLSGSMRYEDTTGAHGELAAGSLEWLQAGGGVWHDASPIGTDRFHGYQLWLALPQAIENGPPQSQYLPTDEVLRVGPARVVLGRYGDAVSPVRAPAGLSLLHVHLADGERWRYQPPTSHTVAWAHTNRGTLLTGGERLHNELAIFGESEDPIDFIAEGDTDFIVASAIKHPHDLVLGYYSVHTGVDALQKGEAEIARIGEKLRSLRRIR
jgi:redox-sensitive bicupin YhaK (pirin superfamily)